MNGEKKIKRKKGNKDDVRKISQKTATLYERREKKERTEKLRSTIRRRDEKKERKMLHERKEEGRRTKEWGKNWRMKR